MGLHIPVDDVRHMVVGGLSDMRFEDETAIAATFNQIRLAREATSRIAQTYSEGGFSVFIDDFWLPEPDPDKYYQLPAAHRIVLNPTLEIALKRLYGRNPEEGSYKKTIEEGIRFIHNAIQNHPKTGWYAVDSSHLSVEETVDQILQLTQANF